MAEDKKPKDKNPEGRTAYIEKNMPEGIIKKAVMGISKLGDAVGFTQEKEYKGKTTEELSKKGPPEKKKSGGKVGYKKGGVTRGDGICKKGHTKGKMI